MNLAAFPIQVVWNEDGSATVFARITGGPNATGDATGIAGEGKWIKQADLSTISRSVFDLAGATPNTPVSGPTTITISTAIYDTPQTATTFWSRDSIGWNFTDTIPAGAFPTATKNCRAQYKFIGSDSITVGWANFEGPVNEQYGG